jgi:hypothetical protein
MRLALHKYNDSRDAFVDGTHSPEFINGDLIKYPDYFIFAVSRNPWGRFVSAWKYLQKSFHKSIERTFIKGLSLKETALNPPKSVRSGFCPGVRDHDYRHMTRNQIDILIDESGKFIPNMVIKLENSQEGFNAACDKIGIPRQQLPHHNKTKHKHYTEYYDDETREIIAERYAKDIEYFGYEFGG